MPITEADTCRKYVLPRLYDAGWTDDQIREQKTFTNGRIIVIGDRCKRGKQKRADYILHYRQDFRIGVIEAKSAYKRAADGIQQAKEYAEGLGVKFAFSTNGKSIIEHSFLTGSEIEIARFPSPDELWSRLRQAEGITDDLVAERILAPNYRVPDKPPRYYQEIAINRAIKAILSGKKRVLLTMATGTGKTLVLLYYTILYYTILPRAMCDGKRLSESDTYTLNLVPRRMSRLGLVLSRQFHIVRETCRNATITHPPYAES